MSLMKRLSASEAQAEPVERRLTMTFSLPHLLQRRRFAKEAIGASNF